MSDVILWGLGVGIVLVLIIDIGRRAYLMQKFPHAYKRDRAGENHNTYTEDRQATVADYLRKTPVTRPLAKYFEP